MIKPRQISTYFLVFVLTSIAFFGFHYLGNQIDADNAQDRVLEAFKKDNLIRDHHPFRKFSSQSVRSLIGASQWSDCGTLLSVLVPPSNRLEDAIVPKTLWFNGINACDILYRIVYLQPPELIVDLKARYWFGWKPVMQILLNQASVFQINVGLKLLTLFAYLIFAVMTLLHSRQLFILMLPVVTLGFFTSGVPYYGGMSLPISNLSALLTLIGLMFFINSQASWNGLRLFMFVAGMISSFFYNLDGHLILLLPLSFVLIYFGRSHDSTGNKLLGHIAFVLLIFVLGFTLSVAVNQLAKIWYLGLDEVVNPFFDELTARMPQSSDQHELDAISIILLLFNKGYFTVGTIRHTEIYGFIIYSSALVLTGAILTSAYLAVKRKDYAAVIGVGVFLAAILMVFIRLAIFSQHSSVHVFFIGRYMYVPLALCWSAMFYALYCARLTSKRAEAA